MAKQQRRVTSADVARASRVSRATVSYVLNNDPRQTIPAETRERVLAAAQALGYQPSPAARVLRSGSSQIVLAVLPFEQIDPGMARDLQGLEAGLAVRGYSLVWYVGRGVVDGATHPAANLTPAAVLTYAAATEPADEAFLRRFNAPIVTVESAAYREVVGRTQAAYLHQRGCQQMVFAAPGRGDVQRLAQARLAGVRQGCAGNRLEPLRVLVIPSSRAGARELIGELIGVPLARHGPLGFCCYNDEIALAVLAALADLGVAVPAAAAVIGCDDIPLAQFSVPALTTIGFDPRPFHEHLVEQILATIAGQPIGPAPDMQVMVIARDSA